MAVNSKNKGSTFERKISNLFSEHFKQYTGIEKSFRRNVSSGSYFGGKNQSRILTHDLDKATFGDIIGPDRFSFNLELKHYKEAVTFTSIIKQNVKDWDLWLKQSKQDSLNSNKKMAVIIKYNNVDEIVILDELFGSLKSIINYKQYYIVTLENFLEQDDSFFFS